MIRRTPFRLLAILVATAATLVVVPTSAHATPGWSIVARPDAVGLQVGALDGIACTSANACIAVGSHGSATDATYAEQWDGQRWRPMATPAIASDTVPLLVGVACARPDLCFAVGINESRTGNEDESDPLLEQWDGAHWTLTTIAVPNHDHGELNGISCGGPTSCIAVGTYFDHERTQGRLIEHWDGARWTFESSPSPSPEHVSQFSAVSCPTATDCVAVGEALFRSDNIVYRVAMAEHRDASGWTIETSSLSTHGTMTSVACPDTWHCLAEAVRRHGLDGARRGRTSIQAPRCMPDCTASRA
jgi:hypothetical protein